MALTPDVIELLDEEGARINHPDFIAADPVQFPRRFSDIRDIEITAFLAAMVAWGNRKMICRNVDKMLSLMDNNPKEFVADKGYELINPDENMHRTFFGRHLQYYLRGLHSIYRRFPSLDAFAADCRVGESEFPAWEFARSLSEAFREANGGAACSQVVPTGLDTTALKRINMALRWLVRKDGIVDLGVWESISPSRLFIPLDVHVGNVSRELGLLERRSNDRKAVEQLTATLREIRPHDPVFYDFALFGIGVERNRK